MEAQKVKNGDIIVVHGDDLYDRDLVKFTDAKTLVAYFRERDYPNDDSTDNKEYMKNVVDAWRDVYGTNANAVPFHNEESFVAALFRLGLCGVTTLN